MNEGHERLYLSLHTRMTMIGHVKRGDPLIGLKIMLFLLNIAWFIFFIIWSLLENQPAMATVDQPVKAIVMFLIIVTYSAFLSTALTFLVLFGERMGRTVKASLALALAFCGILFLMLAFTT